MLSWRDIDTWTVTLSLEGADSFKPDCNRLPRLARGEPVTRTMTSSGGCAIAVSGRLQQGTRRSVLVRGTIAGPGNYVIGRDGLRRVA